MSTSSLNLGGAIIGRLASTVAPPAQSGSDQRPAGTKVKTAAMDSAADLSDMRKRLMPIGQPTGVPGSSAQDDAILRQAPLRMARIPGDQTPRKKTPGDRPGEHEPDHRRQADCDDEHAADNEDEPANVAGDFRGGEVDLRRSPLRFGRSRNVGRMTVVPRVNHDREQRAGR